MWGRWGGGREGGREGGGYVPFEGREVVVGLAIAFMEPEKREGGRQGGREGEGGVRLRGREEGREGGKEVWYSP